MRAVTSIFVSCLMAMMPSVAGSVDRDAVAPVRGVVTHRFTAPKCEKCRGPRGVEIRVTPNSPVRAAIDGEVTFAGQVSRRLFVVQRVEPGVLVTYGWLESLTPRARAGDRVARGTVLGVTGSLFYLGARVRGRYVDPLTLLGFGRPRLVGAVSGSGVTLGQ